FDRVPLKANIGLATQSNLYTGFTNDISEGGVFVTTHQLLPIGTEVEIEVSFADVGGPSVKARAVVRWIRDEDAGEGDPGLGVNFLDLDDEIRTWIQRFVDSQRQPIFYEKELTATGAAQEETSGSADLAPLRASSWKILIILGAVVIGLAIAGVYLFRNL
ncbi:MAG: TIGR02266 family protein, partial [Deltaproteobacteria bacterium]|nr:TIGR02266 family protein [Deltaproteobacteria bacterium]